MSESVLLRLPMPPSVNHYWRRGKYSGMYISEKGLAFRKAVFAVCLSPVVLFARERLRLSVVLHFKDRRKCDIDNRVKALCDALQEARIFADDGQIDELIVRRGEVRREPCCVVEVDVLGE